MIFSTLANYSLATYTADPLDIDDPSGIHIRDLDVAFPSDDIFRVLLKQMPDPAWFGHASLVEHRAAERAGHYVALRHNGKVIDSWPIADIAWY